MKKNKNGFILAETIAISTVVLISLVIIYNQFIIISNNYKKTFDYNNVNELYLLENVRDYIFSDGLNELIKDLNGKDYIDITACPNSYFTEYIYCETLFKYSNIKTIIFTNENISSLKNNISNTSFSEKMKKYIKNINNTNKTNYRLIVEFNNETYATLKIKI